MPPDASSAHSPSLAPAAASRPAASAPLNRSRWVKETRFGHWFLGTNVWSRYVVEVAIRDLAALLPPPARPPRLILDAGSGPGVALPLLDRFFQPASLLAIDIDPQEVARSRTQAGFPSSVL